MKHVTLYLEIHNCSQESALSWRLFQMSDWSCSSESQLSSSGHSHCSASFTPKAVSMRSTVALLTRQQDNTNFQSVQKGLITHKIIVSWINLRLLFASTGKWK